MACLTNPPWKPHGWTSKLTPWQTALHMLSQSNAWGKQACPVFSNEQRPQNFALGFPQILLAMHLFLMLISLHSLLPWVIMGAGIMIMWSLGPQTQHCCFRNSALEIPLLELRIITWGVWSNLTQSQKGVHYMLSQDLSKDDILRKKVN